MEWDMNLSKNLTLNEVLATNTGLDNTPVFDHELKLFYLAQFLFQPIRDKFGPIRITSGYRSPAVNMAVGGSPVSQHCRGEAIDMVPLNEELLVVFDWIILHLTFGQVILEKTGKKEWIHLSMPRMTGNNNEAFTYDGKKYNIYG